MAVNIDWTKIAGPLTQAGGTILGSLIGGPAGAVVGPAIGAVLGQALGVPADPDAIGAALGTPGAAATVAQVEANHAAAIQASADRAEALIKDVQDARRQELALIDKGSVAAWGAPVVSVVVVAGFIGLAFLLIFRAVPDGQAPLVLLGTLATGFGQVLNYYLGSSAGSARKDDAMRTNLAAANRALATK